MVRRTRSPAAGLDLDGTGDSAGDQWEPDRLSSWRRTLALAGARLRELGLEELTLIGARLGASLALLEGAALRADRVAAWLPLAVGRRYAKELKLLSEPVPEEFDRSQPAGTITFAGNVFSASTVDDFRCLMPTDLQHPAAPSILVIDDPTGASEPVVSQLRSLGGDVGHLQLDGSEEALRTAPEFATVPDEILDTICDWIGPDTSARSRAGATIDDAGKQVTIAWRGGRITETVLRLGGDGHVGILTAPETGEHRPTTLVLLNPGSETHVGPGRVWVELARDLALDGHRTVRIEARRPGRD